MNAQIICKPYNLCNQNCSYCFDKKFQINPQLINKKDLIDFFKKVVNEFQEITWTWHGGEPLLVGREWFEDIMFTLNKIREQETGEVKFVIQTNATLLDEEGLKLLKRYNIKIGSSYDINTKFRQYEIPVNDNIAHEIIVLTKYNIDHLIDIYEFFGEKNIDISFNFPFEQNHYKLEDVLGDIDYAINKYKEFIAYYLKQQKYINVERQTESFLNLAIGNPGIVCTQTRCVSSNMLVITSDGELWHCDNTEFPEFHYGNIKDYISFDKLKQSQPKKWSNTPTDCLDCEYKNICGYGCLNCRLKESNAEKPYSFFCKLMKEIIGGLHTQVKDISAEEMMELSIPCRRLLVGKFYLPESIIDVLGKQYLLIFPTNTEKESNNS